MISQEGQCWSCNWECLYCDSSRDIQGYIASAVKKSLRLCPSDFPQTQAIFPCISRSILEELILCKAPTAGQDRKILPSWFSNTGKLNFNIIMFSNWECPVIVSVYVHPDFLNIYTFVPIWFSNGLMIKVSDSWQQFCLFVCYLASNNMFFVSWSMLVTFTSPTKWHYLYEAFHCKKK